MSGYDEVIWWIGAAVIAAIGIGGAVAIIFGLLFAYTTVAIIFIQRAYNVTRNMERIHAWVKNGRPEFQLVDENGEPGGSCYRMWPTEGSRP